MSHRIGDILLCLSPGQHVIPVVSAGQGQCLEALTGETPRQRTCTCQVLEPSTHLSFVQSSVTEVQPGVTLHAPCKGWM